MRWALGGALALLFVAGVAVALSAGPARAGCFGWGHPSACAGAGCGHDDSHVGELGGSWYWMRSPDEEKRVVAGLYNRYCIRCHGVDGRGVCDIPDVPNFT